MSQTEDSGDSEDSDDSAGETAAPMDRPHSPISSATNAEKSLSRKHRFGFGFCVAGLRRGPSSAEPALCFPVEFERSGCGPGFAGADFCVRFD
jgi:hypothetical protein